jgi:glycine betaine/choline ABC-type transport system substrate-binding protein
MKLLPAIPMASVRVPSLPARHEQGERQREGQLDKIASSPHPSPPSFVRRRGGKRLAVAAFLKCLEIIAVIMGAILLAMPVAGASQPVVVGSKKFTESYVLGEIAKRVLEENGVPAEHRQGMGGTIILWEALTQGAITCYPEYTGTINEEILKTGGPVNLEEMRKALAGRGVGVTGELGFNNTYALVMRRERARQLGIAGCPGH